MEIELGVPEWTGGVCQANSFLDFRFLLFRSPPLVCIYA